MKNIIIIISIFFSSDWAFAQNKIFLDRSGKVIDSMKAESYLIVFDKSKGDTVYQMKQYSKDGFLMVSGSFFDAELSIPHGEYSYYEIIREPLKGNRIKIGSGIDTPYRKPINHYLTKKGVFVMGKQNGIWTTYHPNAAIAKTETFKMDVLEGDYQAFTSNGNIDMSGSFLANKKDGEWREYGGMYNAKYKAGVLVKRTIDKQREKEIKQQEENEHKYDVGATPKASFLVDLRRFVINANTGQPKGENIRINFTIDEEGKISKVNITDTDDLPFKIKIEEFILKYGDWIPGTIGIDKQPTKTIARYLIAL